MNIPDTIKQIAISFCSAFFVYDQTPAKLMTFLSATAGEVFVFGAANVSAVIVSMLAC